VPGCHPLQLIDTTSTSVDSEWKAGRTARPRTEDSGLFWYFGPLNWEMLVKVVDGTTMNGHFWLRVASATDVGFELMVRDTVTGVVKSYTKEAGAPAQANRGCRGVPGHAGAVAARNKRTGGPAHVASLSRNRRIVSIPARFVADCSGIS